MKQESEINLLEQTITLFEEHLAQAIDEYKIAISQPLDKTHNELIELRHTTSSITHSVCSLDSLVNYLGFELFFNNKSEDYVLPNQRSVALQKLLKSWDFRLSILDKLDLILEESKSKPLDQTIRDRFSELNTLRNWLIHGLPYTITYLEETINSGLRSVSTIYDYEMNFEKDKKKKRFPKTGFQPPSRLNREDAKTALFIVFEIITYVLSQRKLFHTTIITFYEGEKEHWLGYDSTVETLVSDFGLA